MQTNDFITTLKGRWLAQQTLYNMCNEQSQSYKCEVNYKDTTNVNNFIFETSKKLSYLEQRIINGLEISWNSNTNLILQNIILFVYQKNQTVGKFLKWNTKNSNSIIIGNFEWGQSNLLNFTTSKNGLSIKEKIFIPSGTLKLSSCIVKKYKICILVSFISEIKFNKSK